MDSYAAYRAGLAAQGQRHGRSLSVNWPLWAEGGMAMEPAALQRMLQTTGMAPMETAAGVAALYRAADSGQAQVAVLAGQSGRLRALLLAAQSMPARHAVQAPAAPRPAATDATDADDAALHDQAVEYFKTLLSSTVKMPAERIEAGASMDNYGIDSLMVMQMTEALESVFGPLSKTLFFEYQTIEDIAGYFLREHRSRLMEQLGMAGEAPAGAPAALPAPVPAPARGVGRKSRYAGAAAPGAATPVTAGPMDIAIVGLNGRYPEAVDLDAFWRNLKEGRDSITEIPKERWDHSIYFDPDKSKLGKTYAKWGGFIEGADHFDPLFFGISPLEAEIMDPQERIFLQCAYAAMEDAGYAKDARTMRSGAARAHQVGVFVGVMYEEYQLYGAQEQVAGRNFALSGSASTIANRVSYYFNFSGPSVALDTMCSSSLTAIHLACQSIRNGDCVMAIAGGVNLSIHPNKYLMLGQARFASQTGQCKSFGVGGDGYVPGEGVGAVVLKPLAQAVADGDQIYGVIKGTAINHGGKTNGYTVPNPAAQSQVIQDALQRAAVDPRAISYIEAHGTGTALGDPIEIAGLTKAFGVATRDTQFCAIGSVKSNIGHCESAAGIAGLTKVLLQMKHRQLAPSLHSEVLNPNIDFAATPFVVQRELSEWKRPLIEADGVVREYPRLAGISSFGAGGANAHLLLEEYTGAQAAGGHAVDPVRPALVVLSAKNVDRLKDSAAQLAAWLRRERPDPRRLGDMAYTLQVGRQPLEERLAVQAVDAAELAELLARFAADGTGAVTLGNTKRDKATLPADKAALAADIAQGLERGDLGALATLWVKGADIDWNALHGAARPRRISLPTYPFTQRRYWIPGSDASQFAAMAAAGAEPVREPAQKPEPKPAPEPAPKPAQAAAAHKEMPDAFDPAFYTQLFSQLEGGELSIDAAVATAQTKMTDTTEF
jgi:polyketide synthase PksN